MRTRERMITEIKAYLAASGQSARWLGFQVTGDAKFLLRLERGENVSLRLLERVEAIMNGETPTPLRVVAKRCPAAAE